MTDSQSCHNPHREAILQRLLDEMAACHRRRHARRRVMMAVTPLGAVALLAAIMLRPHMPVEDQAITQHAGTGAPWRPAPAVHVVRLTDEQLLDELAAINRPAGLVRAADRTWLTRQVTDDAIRERESS